MSQITCFPCGEAWETPDAEEFDSIEHHKAQCPVLNEIA